LLAQVKPRARIHINAEIQTEGFTGKPINGYGSQCTNSRDHGQPPDYDFVVFQKSRPEVGVLRTAGATDQTFLPERIHCNGYRADSTTEWPLVNGLTLFGQIARLRSLRFVDIVEVQRPKTRARIHINAVIHTEGFTGKPINGYGSQCFQFQRSRTTSGL
jgi:hypothetical protein